MNINIDNIIDMILYCIEQIAEFTVTIGGISIGIIDFFLVFILVDTIILFIKAFTSSKDGDSGD